MIHMQLRWSAVPLILWIQAALLSGAVTSIEITNKSEVLAGKQIGSHGPYERIEGTVRFAVDPKSEWNKSIADIGLAPLDGRGRVEFSANFYILQPVDAAKSNGTALVEVSNRGGKALLGTFDFAHGSADPKTEPDFGDGFLLRQGFTLVWIGWEFDVPESPDMLRLNSPVATEQGRPITGLVRSEWTGNEKVDTIPLGDRAQMGYPVAEESDSANAMYVRDEVIAARTIVPRSAWRFSDRTHVSMPSGFTPGRIYEIVYRAKDPG